MKKTFTILLAMIWIAGVLIGCQSSLKRPDYYCVEGDCENGHGKMLMIDGRLYEGEFKDGKWHGQGKLTVENETVYEGEFVEGQFAGVEILEDLEEPEDVEILERGWGYRMGRKAWGWINPWD